MKRLRILLLPIMSIAEMIFMALCLLVAVFSIDTSIRMIEASKKLPEIDWYFGLDSRRKP